jgi:hypothetical protein
LTRASAPPAYIRRGGFQEKEHAMNKLVPIVAFTLLAAAPAFADTMAADYLRERELRGITPVRTPPPKPKKTVRPLLLKAAPQRLGRATASPQLGRATIHSMRGIYGGHLSNLYPKTGGAK